jgi:hypothetical protein
MDGGKEEDTFPDEQSDLMGDDRNVRTFKMAQYSS